MIATPNEISDYYHQEPIQLDEQEEEEEDEHETRQCSSQTSKRSSSASELFRRSSAYLRSKFDILRGGTTATTSHLDNTIIDTTRQPKKAIMKTTISIPMKSSSFTTSPILSTPTITQYPPKPLVYSPIEPIPTDTNTNQHQHHHIKPLLHRISMPLLRVYNDTANLTRHASFGRRRKSEPDSNTKKKLKRAKQQQ